MAETKHLPIGIFDSGMGGLSVLNDIKNITPNESFIYYADNLNSPYGNLEEQKIISFTKKGISYLFTKNIKMLIIACNTVTAAAVKQIREVSKIPVIGLEPAILPAIKQTKTNKILLLATKATLRFKKYDNLPEGKTLISCPCEDLANVIENNYENDDLINQKIKEVIKPYDNTDYDCMVLGCTHYVLKRKLFENICGGKITILDGNQGTALNTVRILNKNEMLNDGKYNPFTKLIMTDGTKEKYGIYKNILSDKQ